ncbi:MAG: group II truncated hemoglobin [Betaproteobacteria bacterium]|nr:group II truncated hemoglobin [Betaproteobacteria bacterium]
MSAHYARLGGEAGVRRLVDRFYDLMDSDPDYYAVRKLHPGDLGSSREKLFLFLSGWTGGPPLYTDKFGHPMLRRRHLPFPIGEVERDQWMACMNRAMDELGVEPALREELTRAFFKTADFMRNREG